MQFVIVTLKIESVKLKLLLCFRAIRISTISLLMNLLGLKIKSILGGAKSAFSIPKNYSEQPRHLYMGIPPLGVQQQV